MLVNQKDNGKAGKDVILPDTAEKAETKYKETKTSRVTSQRNKLNLAACWKTQMQLSASLVTENETGYVNYLFTYQLCYVLLSRDICII